MSTLPGHASSLAEVRQTPRVVAANVTLFLHLKFSTFKRRTGQEKTAHPRKDTTRSVFCLAGFTGPPRSQEGWLRVIHHCDWGSIRGLICSAICINLIKLDTVKFPSMSHACKIALMIKWREAYRLREEGWWINHSAIFAQFTFLFNSLQSKLFSKKGKCID